MADTGGRASRSDRKEQLRQKRLLEEEKRRTAFSGPSEIKREEFTQDEIISKSGAFGEVWAGVCRGTPVAVKIPKKKKRLTKKEFESFLDEVSVMKSALHTNLCLFMGACYEPVNDTSGTLYIVMERLTGDLDTLLLPRDEASLVDVKKRFSLSVRLNWATQAARGLAWLHGMGILHRDIKLNNILYDNEHHIKVCDFGLAQFEAQHDSDSSKATGLRGSPFKMAPELFKDGTTPTAKSDVWSFAVTLWEMLKSETAYSKLIQEKTGKTCASSFADYFDVVIDQGNRMTIPEEWPAELNTLLTSCWDADPENRPPMCEVLTQLTACEAKAKNLENVRALQAEIKNFHGDNPILFWFVSGVSASYFVVLGIEEEMTLCCANLSLSLFPFSPLCIGSRGSFRSKKSLGRNSLKVFSIFSSFPCQPHIPTVKHQQLPSFIPVQTLMTMPYSSHTRTRGQ